MDLMHLDELYELFKFVLDVLYKRWLTVVLKRILAYRLQIVIIAFCSFIVQRYIRLRFVFYVNVYVVYIEPIGSSF